MADTSRDEFIEWARKSCRPLNGLDLELDVNDLEPLATIVGNASVVGLGESWHSSSQLLCLKNRMVRFLIEYLNFNVIVFEGGLPGSSRMDEYVGGAPGDCAAALRAFGQPMWLNSETVDMVDWLRAKNSSRHEHNKIRAFGLDPAYPGEAIHAILSFLGRIDPAYDVPHENLLRRIETAFKNVQVDSRAKSAVWGATSAYEQLSEIEQDQFQRACHEIVSRLECMRSTYTFLASNQEFEWILRQAVMLMQTLSIVSVRSRSLSEANMARDLAFAENLMWFRNHLSGTEKIIVLAHNIHVAREPFSSSSLEPPVSSLGGYLSDWIGNEYVAIGSAVGRGRNSKGANGGLVDPSFSGSADNQDSSTDDSNDQALEEVGVEQFLLPISSELEWATKPVLTRSHLDPQSAYRLEKAYDALIYVDRIVRSAPL